MGGGGAAVQVLIGCPRCGTDVKCDLDADDGQLRTAIHTGEGRDGGAACDVAWRALEDAAQSAALRKIRGLRDVAADRALDEEQEERRRGGSR